MRNGIELSAIFELNSVINQIKKKDKINISISQQRYIKLDIQNTLVYHVKHNPQEK